MLPHSDALICRDFPLSSHELPLMSISGLSGKVQNSLQIDGN